MIKEFARGAFAMRFALILLLALVAVGETRGGSASLIASTEPGWPQFRGPRRDGICDERGLLAQWPEAGPRAIWSVTNVGRGFSSPIISSERLIITGDVGEHLVLFAFDLAGKALWRATNGASWKTPYPGARASVTVNGGRVYHENAHGRVACFEAASGRELWSLDVIEAFGGTNITWALSENLLVDERAVYVTAGGSNALVVALNKTHGAVLWRSEPLFDPGRQGAVENASYVSPILVKFGERRLIIGCSLRHLYCVDADSGVLQWTRPMPTTYSVLAMMPALIGDGVFMTAPHGKGGRLWKLIAGENGKVGAEEVWHTPLDTCQGSVVHRDGKIIGSFYPGRKGWAAVDAKTGAVLYGNSDFVKGAPLYADGRVYALCEDGWMLLLEPKANEFTVHGRFRLANASARDAWAHPVIHDGRLYLRYHDTLTCFDVRAR